MYTRIFFTLICLFWTGRALTQPQLSKKTRLFLNEWKNRQHQTYRTAVSEDWLVSHGFENKQGIWTTDLLVETTKNGFEFALPSGVNIHTEIGQIYTLSSTVYGLLELTKRKDLRLLELPELMLPTMLETTQKSGAAKVHAGVGLPIPFEGKNTIIGVIDIGFDLTHPNFRTKDGTDLKIVAMWDQNDTIGLPPGGFSYGVFTTGTSALMSKQRDTYATAFSHGSLTSGMAAGSGFGVEGGFYRGIAPEANLILVSSPLRNTKVIDATKFIFDYARERNMPAVVNMSFGGWSTPFDGTTAYDRALSDLCGEGRVIVASMGNEGNNFQHIQKVFSDANDKVKTLFRRMPKRTALGIPPAMDIWGTGGKHVAVSILLVDSLGTEKVRSLAFSSQQTTEDTTYLIHNQDSLVIYRYATQVDTNNGQPNQFFILDPKLKQLLCGFEMQPEQETGKVDVYAPFLQLVNGVPAGNAFAGFEPGDQLSNFRTPGGTSKRVISAGSYVLSSHVFNMAGDTVWGADAFGNRYVKEEFANYSSRGPDANGVVKPDITASGVHVSSSVSSFNWREYDGKDPWIEKEIQFEGKNYRYAPSTGTSMAAPVIAGAVALMFEANPTLTPEQVRIILRLTATRDQYTGDIASIGSNQWGWGKLNVYEAVKAAANWNKQSGKRHLVYPNPALDRLFITSTNNIPANGNFSYRIYDLQGKLQISEESKPLQTVSIVVKDLPPALYLLVVNDSEGRKTYRFSKNP